MSANTGGRPLDPVEAIRHLDSLYRAALRLTRDRARAEDLMQATYTRALRDQNSYQPGISMKAWLFAIMRKLFWARFHEGQPDVLTLDGNGANTFHETIAEMEAGPQATALDRVAHHQVVQAVEALPEIHREVVLLVDVEAFTYQETAEIIGVPIGTVMSRLHRARAHLQGVLLGHARESGIV